MPDKAVALVCLAAFLGVLFAVSGYAHWWGGESFGPRLLAPSLPFLLVLTGLSCSAVESRWRSLPRSARVGMAMATHEMDKTIRFWRDLLGMRLIAGLGRPGYRRYFFAIS